MKLLIVAVLGIGALTACGSSSDDGPALSGELTVVATTWNGWDPDFRPTPATSTIPTREGETATFQCLGDTIELRVSEVGDESVTLHLSQELAPQTESGGSNHNQLTDEFEIEVDESVSFSTPTLDAGCNYAVELASA